MGTESAGSDGKAPLGKYIALALLSALAGFAAVYVTVGRPDNGGIASSPAAQGTSSPKEGQAAGSLTAFIRKAAPEPVVDVSFMGPDGGTVKLSDFKGKVVLLNLWATWCAPCRKEMPSLDRLQAKLGSDKFEVVALAVDRAGLEAAKKFFEETKIQHLKLYVDSTAKAGSALKALGLPTTLLLDHEGREIGRLAGPAEWDSSEAEKLVEAELR